LASEEEGSDEDLQAGQSASESESDSDDAVDRNEALASELLMSNVETKTDSLGNEPNTDTRTPVKFNQDTLNQFEQRELDERTDNSTDMEAEPSNITDETIQASNEPSGKRERHKRNLVLDDCLCRDRVDQSASNAIQCKRNGCETVWVSNLPFIALFCCKVPHNSYSTT
jgi:hypothetical protein